MHRAPQQAGAGAPRYGPGVLMGGHAEDEEQRRGSMRAFLAQTAAGALKSTRWQQRVTIAHQQVALSSARADGCVHFGDVIALRHAASSAALSVNVHDTDGPGGAPRAESAAASAVPPPSADAPAARSTFLISKYLALKSSPLEPQYDGNVLRFGQRFHIIANPMARGEPFSPSGGASPLFLCSWPAGPSRASKYGRRQPVAFSNAPGHAAVWMVAPLDPAERGAAEGAPVPAGALVAVVHCGTGAPLCVEEGVAFPTDFEAREHEVCAHLATDLGMQRGLEHQARGDYFRALPKSLLAPNHWRFENGAAAAEVPPAGGEGGFGGGAAAGEGEGEGGAGALLERLAAELEVRPGGVAALDTALSRLCDFRGDMDAGDLLLSLLQHGVRTDDEEVCMLLAEYPGAGPGRVAARVVAAALRQAALRAAAAGGGGDSGA